MTEKLNIILDLDNCCIHALSISTYNNDKKMVEYMTKDFFVRIGNLSVNNSRREGLIVEIDVRDHDKDKDAHRIEAFASSLGIDTASIKKNTTTSFPNMPSNASRKVWEYMLAMRELS